MKIGIITFHRAINYGAVLQAYALKEFLNQMGFTAEIIDYRNEYFDSLYYSNKINLSKYKQFESGYGAKQKIKRMIEVFWLKTLRKKFIVFQEKYLEINGQKKIYSLNQLSNLNEYDYFITGSDQVWNLKLTNEDINYFLKFANPEKRISFAASIGGYEIETKTECINILKKYKAISVREKTTKDKLMKLEIENISEHLDPVFLLSKQRWDEIASEQKATNYVLLFEVGRNTELFRLASEFAEKNRKKLFYLSTDFVRSAYINVKNIYSADPREFISWIKYADYVFTNSFHATAFSIIYTKKFYCHINPGMKSNDRLINVLNLFGIPGFCNKDKIGSIKGGYKIINIIKENEDNVKGYFEQCLK